MCTFIPFCDPGTADSCSITDQNLTQRSNRGAWWGRELGCLWSGWVQEQTTSYLPGQCQVQLPTPSTTIDMQTHYRESQQALGVGGKDSPGVAVSLMIFSCVHEAVLSRGTVGRSQGLQPGRLELRSQLELTSCATSNMQMNLSVLSSSTENQG